MFRRKRTQGPTDAADRNAGQPPWPAEMVALMQQVYGGVQADDRFTAVLMGRRAAGRGNGIMKYTLSVHGPGHHSIVTRLHFGLGGRIDAQREIMSDAHGKLPLPLQLPDIPVAMRPRVLKWHRTEYHCHAEAEHVLASAGWHRDGDWIPLLGKGRWFTGDHGSWAAPVLKTPRRRSQPRR